MLVVSHVINLISTRDTLAGNWLAIGGIEYEEYGVVPGG